MLPIKKLDTDERMLTDEVEVAILKMLGILLDVRALRRLVGGFELLRSQGTVAVVEDAVFGATWMQALNKSMDIFEKMEHKNPNESEWSEIIGLLVRDKENIVSRIHDVCANFKEVLADLQTQYTAKNCCVCEKALYLKIADETTFNSEDHIDIATGQLRWGPHFDVEYRCENCGYYEHYTHNTEGQLLSVRLDKVFFDLRTGYFSIFDGPRFKPAGKLPEGIEVGSNAFWEYFASMMRKAYSRTQSSDIDHFEINI